MTVTTDASRAAFERANKYSFGRSRALGSSAKRNQAKLKKMSIAERETGMTAEQLADQQRQLREDYYRRQQGRLAA